MGDQPPRGQGDRGRADQVRAYPPQDRVPFLLGQLGTLVVRGLKGELAPHDLHPRHSAVLTALSTTDGMSSSALSDVLSMHRSALVALVDELEAKGWLIRARSECDRRVHDLQITDAGREVVRTARETSARFEQDFLQALDPEEIEQLKGFLLRLADSHGVLRTT